MRSAKELEFPLISKHDVFLSFPFPPSCDQFAPAKQWQWVCLICPSYSHIIKVGIVYFGQEGHTGRSQEVLIQSKPQWGFPNQLLNAYENRNISINRCLF